MLSPSLHTLRLFLHVLAATVWVGGQITLAGLVPGLRAVSEDAPRTVARRFNNRLAWPAFAVLFVTGIWNLFEVRIGDQSTEWQVTLFVKLLVVALSGISAAAHAGAKRRGALAVWGAVTGLTAIGALWLGIQLHG
jgi:putative copper export protein